MSLNIKLEKLGVLEEAEFSLADLTIICGENNSGKTYASYALYGFLEYLRNDFVLRIDDDIIEELHRKKTVKIDLARYLDGFNPTLRRACKSFLKNIPMIFAGSKDLFRDSKVKISAAENPVITNEANFYLAEFSHDKNNAEIGFSCSKYKPELTATIGPNSQVDWQALPLSISKGLLSGGIKLYIFSECIPKPFIASVERTGCSLFHKPLDAVLSNAITQKSYNESFLDSFRNFPTPVLSNLNFMRALGNYVNRESFVKKEHPELLENFASIVGGEYTVTDLDEVRFTPNSPEAPALALVESSSSVRSMVIINFYLHHLAQKGDLLIIDEPELNLHPANQRRFARLIASLVNIGIKVFITTHSDYIIKELNTLIMLSNDKQSIQDIAEAEGYKESEYLTTEKVKMYITQPTNESAGKFTLVEAEVTEDFGIEAFSFDKTINKMNYIQDAITCRLEEEDGND